MAKKSLLTEKKPKKLTPILIPFLYEIEKKDSFDLPEQNKLLTRSLFVLKTSIPNLLKKELKKATTFYFVNSKCFIFDCLNEQQNEDIKNALINQNIKFINAAQTF